jgi:hypothetical protein
LEGMAEVLSAQEVECTRLALRKLRVWFDCQR